jgi:hypothetical protein
VPLNTIGNKSLSGGYPTNTVALFQAAASAGVNDAGIMIGSVNGNTPYLSDYGSGSNGMLFYTNKAERMRILANGNVGIGTTAPGATLDVNGGINARASINGTDLITLTDPTVTNGFLRITTAGSSNFIQSGLTGAADSKADLIFTSIYGGSEWMRIKSNGSIGINTTTPSARLHITGPVANASVLQCWMTTSQVLAVTTTGNSANASWNATDTVLRVSRDNGSGRSINAGGTINANGADYAEYMTKDSDFSAQKGDILGVLPSGKLTNQFDAAIHFLLKSTNPCMVGGDVWGTEATVGEKPKNPEESATEEEKAAHAAALAAWEARLEAERQKVDRMAFAGQVPVNIQGATPGNYIIPLRNADGSIGVAAVAQADMSFSQYQSAVGRVISILADGRANVIVKAV